MFEGGRPPGVGMMVRRVVRELGKSEGCGARIW